MGAKHFGARVTRLEDPALLTGRGRFVDDVKLPGMLHACFVRSPHAACAASARSTATAALAMPGVHAVLTADDMPEPIATEPMPMLVPNPAITALRTQHGAGARRGLLCRRAGRRRDRRHPLHRRGCRGGGRRRLRGARRRRRLPRRARATARRARTAISPPMSPRSFRMAYGDVDAAFADAAHVFEEEHLAAPRRRAWRSKAAPCWRSQDAGVGPAHRLVGDRRRRTSRPRARIADLLDRDLEVDPRDRARRRRRLRHQGDRSIRRRR